MSSPVPGGYGSRRPDAAEIRAAAAGAAREMGIPITFSNHEYAKIYQRLWQRAYRSRQKSQRKAPASALPTTDHQPPGHLPRPTCRYHAGVRLVRARADRPSFSYSVKKCQGKRSRQIAATRAKRDAREILRCPVVDAHGRPCPWVAQLPGDEQRDATELAEVTQ